MEDFSKIIYENLDGIQQDEIATALERVYDIIRSGRRSQSSLLNQMILILNDVFDAF